METQDKSDKYYVACRQIIDQEGPDYNYSSPFHENLKGFADLNDGQFPLPCHCNFLIMQGMGSRMKNYVTQSKEEALKANKLHVAGAYLVCRDLGVQLSDKPNENPNKALLRQVIL